jgi:hypothetical protein
VVLAVRQFGVERPPGLPLPDRPSISELGRAVKAKAEIAAVLKSHPQYSLAGIQQRWPHQDPADLDRFVAALRSAGLK